MSYANLVLSQVSVPLTAAATTITLIDIGAPYQLPPVTGGILVIADSPAKPSVVEIIAYTSRSGLVLSGVSRGQEGTTAVAWTLPTFSLMALTAVDFQSKLDAKASKGTNSDITSLTGLTTALSILQGGTGVTTLAALKTALSVDQVSNTTDANKPVSTLQATAIALKASSGANSDITSLTGLTTALSVAQGGTGNTTGLAATATKLATTRTIAVTGDGSWSVTFDGSVAVTAAMTLAASGVAAGTYGGVTVNTKGLVTGATTLLPVANGGTGASTAAAALAALGGVPSTALGVSVATLVAGTVPASQLPSYVDDVLEYATFSLLPAVGETGKIYVTDTPYTAAGVTSSQFRWGGSTYAPIIASPGSTDAVIEGATNLYFTTPRVLATPLTGLSSSTTTAILATDTPLSGLGKAQGQINTLTTAVALKAANGANADITSLTGLTTALSVSQGGTGVTTTAALKTALAVDQVNNTSDANKPVSLAQAAAIAQSSLVGDILVTARNPGALYVPANGGIRAWSALPSLLGVLGLLGGQVGQQYATVSAGTTTTVVDVASAPNPNGGAPLVMQLTTASGVNFSSDGGATWVTKNTVTGTSISYDEYNKCWIVPVSNGYIYISYDNGTTWVANNSAPVIFSRVVADANGTWIAVSPTTATTVWRSNDQGVNWTSSTTGATAIHTAISTDNKGVWCICAGSTIRRSIDGGLTWATQFAAASTQQAISNDRNGVWLSSGLTSSSNTYKSVDNGQTFTLLITPVTSTVTDIAYSQGYFFLVRSVSPQLIMISSAADATVYTVPTAAVLASLIRVTASGGYVVAVNSATTTVLRSAPLFAYDSTTQLQLPNFPVASGLTAWIKVGLKLASSGKTVSLTSSTMSLNPSDMATDEKGVIIAVGTGNSQSIRRSTDFGVTWATVANPTGSYLFYSVATDKNGVWLIGGDAALLRSTDNGATFVTVAAANHGFTSPILQLVIGSNGVVCGTMGTGYIRKSADLGLTWIALNALATGSYRVCTDGAGKWVVAQSTTASRSQDNLQSFSGAPAGLAVAVTDVKMTSAGRVYLCGASTAAKVSNDYGATWSDMTLPVAGSKFAAGFAGIVISYGGTGPQYSLDGGHSWAVSAISSTVSVIAAGVNTPFITSAFNSFYTAALDTPA